MSCPECGCAAAIHAGWCSRTSYVPFIKISERLLTPTEATACEVGSIEHQHTKPEILKGYTQTDVNEPVEEV